MKHILGGDASETEDSFAISIRQIVADPNLNVRIQSESDARTAAISRLTTRRAIRLPSDEITEANIEKIMAEVSALSDEELMAEVVALELGPSVYEEANPRMKPEATKALRVVMSR